MSEDSPDSQGTQKACCCHHKATPRSQQMQGDLQKRLNRVIGQLNGVKAMIDDNRYCGDVLTQVAAVQSALQGFAAAVLQNHLRTCVVEQVQQGNLEVVDEVVDLVRKLK